VQALGTGGSQYGSDQAVELCLERAALLAGGGTVVPELLNLAPHQATSTRSLDEPSREAVEAALLGADGVVSRAAQDLGLSRQALYRRMQRYGLDASA